jgi:hypothetical protein
MTLPKPKFLRSPSRRLDECLSFTGEASDIDCPYTRKLYTHLQGTSSTECDSVAEAYLLYYLPQSRAILSSLLLSGCDTVTISDYIQSKEDVVIAYSKLFFDVSVFPNKLVIKDYVDSLPEVSSTAKNYKALLRAALSLGSRYIAWKMSLTISTELDVNDINSNILEDSYWRAREHKPFNIDDPRAKESKSWAPQVLRAVGSITGSRSEAELSVETLRLRLIKTDSTISKAALQEDIKG